MQREPEPELMDGGEQARAYADADFSEAHDRFVALFRARLPHARPRRVLDLGCGPCDVTRRFARAYPECRITAIDGSAAMLAEARARNRDAGLDDRIEIVEARLPCAALGERRFDAILSNSLLHHLPEPGVLWRAALDAAEPGAIVFVMDLLRPASATAALALVEAYTADAPPILRHDFHRSLHAAYRPDEVRVQLRDAGLGALAVEVASDRHWIAWGEVGAARPRGDGA